jgi:hypothetical protein
VARLRLVCILVCTVVSARAFAQGALTLRGNYWRDRNTRVVQPAIELSKELPSGTVVGAHYLLDAITSASAAAGGNGDVAFTELRNEVGFAIGQRIGPALVSGAYSYSSESDYWAHTAALGALVELWQKTTTIGATLSYGNDRVGQRLGPSTYMMKGGLQSIRGIVNIVQVLRPTLLATASYEIGVLGFGTADNGYQANPYRVIPLGGAHETEPFQRFRQAAAASLYWTLPLGIRRMPSLGLRGSYRFYWDDWGVFSHTPELRLFVPIGPVELRVTGRYYWQREASFWSDNGLVPAYPTGLGLHCTTCFSAAVRDGLYQTADPKLSRFAAEFLELRALIKLTGLRAWKRLPGAAWLSDGILELSYGHYFNGGYAHFAFGDAEVAGVTLSWPL